MLKSLAIVVSQATQQFRSRGQASPRGRFERAQQVAQRTEKRRRRKTVIVLSLIFIVLVLSYSFLFHEIMAREGRVFSWPSSIYWTMTTMTTLGFGDITFTSDLGRSFSVLVLVSGSAFLLVVLPFAFIQFVFIPWINERERRRAPRTMPQSTSGHLILTALGPIEQDLIDRADKTELPYVLVVEDLDEAGRLSTMKAETSSLERSMIRAHITTPGSSMPLLSSQLRMTRSTPTLHSLFKKSPLTPQFFRAQILLLL